MPFPIPSRPAATRHGFGSDFAGGVTESLVRTVGTTLRSLSTADKNRVLLVLAAFIATQLEALEANNEPEEM